MNQSFLLLAVFVFVSFFLLSCNGTTVTEPTTDITLPPVSGVSVELTYDEAIVKWDKSAELLFDYYTVYGLRWVPIEKSDNTWADGYRFELLQKIYDVSICTYRFPLSHPGRPGYSFIAVTVTDQNGVESKISTARLE